MSKHIVSQRAIIREMDASELIQYIYELKSKGSLTEEEDKYYDYAIRQLNYLTDNRGYC